MKKTDQMMPLALTEAERKLILEDLMYIEDEYTAVIRATPTGQPVRFSVGEWEGLGGCIVAEANHIKGRQAKKELDRLYEKINGVADKSPDDVPSLKIYRGEDENEECSTVKSEESIPLSQKQQ